MRLMWILIITAALAPSSGFSQLVNAQGLDFSGVNQQMQWIQWQQNAQMQAVIDAQKKAQEDAMRQQQFAGMTQLVVGACGAMFRQNVDSAGDSKINDLEDTAYTMDQIAYADLESKGYTYDEKLDRETARAVGTDSTIAFAAGCNNFINKEGQLGPWGNYALARIRQNKEAFGANIPSDITKWCPKYPSMNESQRELYWVWTLSAMASSESGCNPAAHAQGPNGTALGLFQVWKPVCPKARNLNNPNENITCAIDLLADELNDRDTLMSTTSNGARKDATYWAVLRVDGRDKGNTDANRKTRAIMEKYKFCH